MLRYIWHIIIKRENSPDLKLKLTNFIKQAVRLCSGTSYAVLSQEEEIKRIPILVLISAIELDIYFHVFMFMLLVYLKSIIKFQFIFLEFYMRYKRVYFTFIA